MSRVSYQGLFNGCFFYADFKGDAKDCINQNDAIINGTPTLVTNHLGLQKSAYILNGSTDFFNAGDLDPTGTKFTVSVWAKKLATGNTEQILVSRRDNSTYTFELNLGTLAGASRLRINGNSFGAVVAVAVSLACDA